jgi:hypothetical protein
MDVKLTVENCCLCRLFKSDDQWNIVPLATDLRALLPTWGHFYNLKSITFLVNSNYDFVHDLLHYLKVKNSNLSLSSTPSIKTCLSHVQNSFWTNSYWLYFNFFSVILSLLIVLWSALLVSKLAVTAFSDHIVLKYSLVNWLLLHPLMEGIWKHC